MLSSIMAFYHEMVAILVLPLKKSPYKTVFLTFASMVAVLLHMRDILLESSTVEMRLLLVVVCAFSLKQFVFGDESDECDRKLVVLASGRAAMQAEKTRLSGIFNRHAEHGNMTEMAKTLERMEDRCHPFLDIMDYNCVVVQYAKGGDPSEAHRWLRRCIDVGLSPKQGMFNSVISSYAKTAAMQQALQVANEMKCAGLRFNTTTYSVFVDAWARAGDAGKAQAWMNQMLADKIEPNCFSFASVFRACAGAGLLEDLDMWFKLSKKHDVQLNIVAFDGLVRTFARRPDAVNAVKWLKVMIEYGVKPDTGLCYEVQAATVDKGDALLAANLSKLMRTAQVQFASTRCLGPKSPILTSERIGTKTVDPDEWELPHQATCGRATGTSMQHVRAAEDQCRDKHAGGGLQMTKTSMGTVPAMRKAVISITYYGIIKCFKPKQYGFISCAATEKIFQQDVFLACCENPRLLTAGQRVSFKVRVSRPFCQPRAYEVQYLCPCE